MSIARTYPATTESLSAGRLLRFLDEFCRLRAHPSPEAKLRGFLTEARPLLRDLAKVEVGRVASPPKVDVERFASQMPVLTALLRESRSRGGCLNPWSVAGLRHSEVRNSRVLASLWDSRLCGAQAISFLNHFLRRITTGESCLPTQDMLSDGYWVRPEHSPITGGQSERIDLTVEGAGFLLLIEIKINAGESGPDQFQRYANTAEEWSKVRGKPASFILLAPFRPTGFDHYYASWFDVAAAAIATLPRRKCDYTFHSHLLENFIQHIAKF